jgi:hypothetical protein
MNEVKYECGGQEYFIDMIGVVRTKDMIMATSDGRLVPRKGRNLKTKIDAGGFLSVMLGKTGKRVKRRICDLLFSNLVDMPVVAEEIKEISDIIFDFKGHSIRSIDGYVGLYDVSTDGVVSSVERSILREDGRRSIKKRYVCKKGISSGGKNFVSLVDKDKKNKRGSGC